MCRGAPSPERAPMAGCTACADRRTRDPNFRRRNSWDLPPSPQVVIAVTVCLVDLVVYCLLFAPTLQRGPLWPLNVAFFPSCTLLFGLGLRTMTVDPASRETAEVESGKEDRAADVKTRYCPVCTLVVAENSKHCWTCNKCVDGFDHHCVWLNTCVGKKNYITFLMSAVALLAMMGCFIASVATCLLLDEEDGYWLTNVSVDRTLMVVISVMALAVNVPVLAADILLVSLHAYLCYTGKTTLAFIKERALQKEQRSGKALRREGCAGSCGVCPKAMSSRRGKDVAGAAEFGPARAADSAAGVAEGSAV